MPSGITLFLSVILSSQCSLKIGYFSIMPLLEKRSRRAAQADCSPSGSLYTNSNKALAALFFRLLFPRALGGQDFNAIQEQLLQETKEGIKHVLYIF